VLHLPKYFGNLSNFISHAIPKFQKTSVIDRGNTTCASVVNWMILIPQFVYVMQGSVLASPIMFTKVHNIKSLS
jgi:hypothetical protein